MMVFSKGRLERNGFSKGLETNGFRKVGWGLELEGMVPHEICRVHVLEMEMRFVRLGVVIKLGKGVLGGSDV